MAHMSKSTSNKHTDSKRISQSVSTDHTKKVNLKPIAIISQIVSSSATCLNKWSGGGERQERERGLLKILAFLKLQIIKQNMQKTTLCENAISCIWVFCHVLVLSLPIVLAFLALSKQLVLTRLHDLTVVRITDSCLVTRDVD